MPAGRQRSKAQKRQQVAARGRERGREHDWPRSTVAGCILRHQPEEESSVREGLMMRP